MLFFFPSIFPDYPPFPAMSKSRVTFIICVKVVVFFVVLCCNPITDTTHREINNPLQLPVEEEVVERPPMFCILVKVKIYCKMRSIMSPLCVRMTVVTYKVPPSSSFGSESLSGL